MKECPDFITVLNILTSFSSIANVESVLSNVNSTEAS